MSTEPSTKPQALTFDLDDTLWDAADVIGRADAALHDWLARHHPRIPERFGPADLRELMAERARQQPEIAHDLTRLRVDALRRAADAAGYAPAVGERAFEVFIAARNRVVLYEDVLPALEALHGRYRLASISNGNADIKIIGLDRFFRAHVSAAEAGAAKPAPAVFRTACERLGVSPAETVHVGDDPDTDVAGAAELGMRTVWVNRAAASWPGGQPPDAEIGALHKLHDVLARLEDPSHA